MPEQQEKEKVALAVEADPTEEQKKKAAEKKKNKEKGVVELSEEDQALKDGLELSVARLQESNREMHTASLTYLSQEIRTSTASMTSVPKPLKFLRPSFPALKEVYKAWPVEHPERKNLADVLSVLAMTMSETGTRECLQFRLEGNVGNLAAWGHEYLRSLSGEISEEYNKRQAEAAVEEYAEVDDLQALVDDIVPFQMSHNAEADAIDLLMEVQALHKLVETNVVDDKNYERVCTYLLRCGEFMSADPDDYEKLLNTAYVLYLQHHKYIDAMRVAVVLDDEDHCRLLQLFQPQGANGSGGSTALERKQMAYILGRHRTPVVLEGVLSDSTEEAELNDIMGNAGLSERFLVAATDMNVADPKAPEDVFKTASRRRPTHGLAAPLDSARENLASTFVNGLVNAAFCKDKLLLAEASSASGGSSSAAGASTTEWVYKNKDHGMLSAAASLGWVMLWNVEEGLNAIDKYFYASDDHIKAGACLGVGVLSSSVKHVSDPAWALLCEHVESETASYHMRLASICGLGIAYAGSNREDILELFSPIVSSTEVGTSFVTVAFAAISLGLVFAGSCNDDVSSLLLQRLMETTSTDFDNLPMARLLCLSLGLVYLGKGERIEVVMETLKVVEHDMRQYAEICLETCAYAGSGNVLQVQKLLRICAEHLAPPVEEPAAGEKGKKGAPGGPTAAAATAAAATPAAPVVPVFNAHQSAAVLGIAVIALGEDVSTEMALRTFDHLLQYAEINVKRIVPLAIALLYVSNPDYAVMEQLSRMSHDTDIELAMGAILGLGVMSAGTNNSRVAGILRQLADFYAKDANALFVVRLAQGLTVMGKGLITLNPFHSDRFLLGKAGLGGMLMLLHSCFDMKATILDKYHFILFFLTPAMSPRFCTTLAVSDEDPDVLVPCPVNVRVGQAVETVGQAGRPKTITGFQTHCTPVLLGHKDRAELASADHRAITSVVEGVVILKKVDPITVDDK